MNVVRWSPFREFAPLLQSFDRPATPVRRADWLPLVDVRETEQHYLIDVEIPAVAATDLAVSVAERVLTVSGERKAQAAQDSGRTFRTERQQGKFTRSFQLPEDADADAISATQRDGVLYLSIAKTTQVAPRSIAVRVE